MPTKLSECPWCGDDGEPLACQLDTTPRSYAVLCANCGAQGPTGSTFEQANEEWDDKAGIVIGRVTTVEDLDGALVALSAHATALRDAVAAGPIDAERAIALGGLAAAVLVLDGLCPNDFGDEN